MDSGHTTPSHECPTIVSTEGFTFLFLYALHARPLPSPRAASSSVFLPSPLARPPHVHSFPLFPLLNRISDSRPLTPLSNGLLRMNQMPALS
jgi:hypothetical protein